MERGLNGFSNAYKKQLMAPMHQRKHLSNNTLSATVGLWQELS